MVECVVSIRGAARAAHMETGTAEVALSIQRRPAAGRPRGGAGGRPDRRHRRRQTTSRACWWCARPAATPCPPGRSRRGTAPSRSACAIGSSARPIRRWAMSSSSTRSATVTGARPTATARSRRCRSAISRWCARRGPAGAADASWQGWYRYFPWEDWRDGRPAAFSRIETPLAQWAATAPRAKAEERLRAVRSGSPSARVERGARARTLRAAVRGGARRAERAAARGRPPDDARCRGPMAVDHRRILATAIGRLRGKIKYRPVVFELMPPSSPCRQLQRTVEALVRACGCTSRISAASSSSRASSRRPATSRAETGGRPARLVRFRREVLVNARRPACACAPSAAPSAPSARQRLTGGWSFRAKCAGDDS